MDAVLYKLLTNDKQARLFATDNTQMLKAAQPPLKGVACDVFGAVFTFTCLLHGIVTNAKRVSVKLETLEPSVYMIFGADENGDIQGFASDIMIGRQYGSIKEMAGNGGCIKIVYDNGADAVFTGIVEITEDDMAQNLSRYFTQSEQTETMFRYFCERDASGIRMSRGVLVQALPFADSVLISQWASRIDNEKDTLSDQKRTLESSFDTVFSDAAVAEKWPVRLQCSCDRQSVLCMLMGLGISELEWTVHDNQDIEVRCGKCGESYRFDAAEITRLIDMMEKEG